MRKILITLFSVFSLLQVQGQTKQTAISEANRLNVNSKQEAADALASKGISESQARKMAELRGISYDAALAEYLKSKKGGVKNNTSEKIVNDVVTDLKQAELPTETILKPKKNKVTKDSGKYFGYNIFKNNPFGQKEYLLGNIDEGYILAPGDELRITVFGDNNLEFVSKIDLNGNISFPNLGMFFAAGNSFETLKERLNIFLGKYYSGLLSKPSRTFLDVSLTQIRPVKVSILGNVNTPGPHLVNGMATVLNALYASGGVDTSGTLRDIKVYRNNKLIKTIDLYDYITQGNLDQDIRLSNNDILFVGPRLSSIYLGGEVKKASIYELKPNESLKDLFRFSGGLTSKASLNNVNISRIKPFEDREQSLVFDRFLTTINFASYKGDAKKKFQLTDGDQIMVAGILELITNQVSIEGNINAPGTYALDVFKDLKTLIMTGAKGLLPETYMEKLDIYTADDKGVLSFKTYKLSEVLNDEVTVNLQENDQIRIYAIPEVQGLQTVTISGYVSEPKTVRWIQDLSLFDLIFQAVSYDELEFQAKVLSSRLDLKRFDVTSGLYNLTQFSLNDLELLKNKYVAPKDEIILYTKSVTKDLSPTVKMVGEVKAPGDFPLPNKMFVEDLILAAGGFLDIADKEYAFVNRLDRDLEKGTYSKLQKIELDIDYMLGLKKSPSNPFSLENDDVVTVVAPIRAKFQPSISVQGEVQFPRSIIIENDQTPIAKVVALAGGFSSNYNLQSSYVERGGTKLYLNLTKDALLDDNINLKDGDVLVIGSKLTSIRTTGAVLVPTVFNWEKGKRAKYYIKNSGGKSKRIESVTVQQANGASKKVGFFRNPKIYPGSIISVIQKPEKVKGANDGKFLDDFVRIFGLIATTLTTILLTSKL